MLKKTVLRCCLLLLVTAFGSTAFAAANPPYASIVAFNYNGGTPNINTLKTLDIINMTPWDISIGPAANTQILKGMSASPLVSSWMKGINTAAATGSTAVDPSFAYHSLQIPLANPNVVWQPLDKQIKPKQNVAHTEYMGDTYEGTAPIIFNSNSFQQSSKTVALNFIVTSSGRFASTGSEFQDGVSSDTYPATTLSYGDGSNNYGWKSNDTNHNKNNATHFLTIQQLQVQGTTNWKPITKNIAGTVAQKGVGGQTPGATVESPEILTVSGLAYPNFSSVAGLSALPNQSYDLVVILQAGGYVDMQLLFLAVPSSNNAFLTGTSAGGARR